MTITATRIDVLLSTLNATDLGSLDSIVEKVEQVRSELDDADQAELAERAGEAVEALRRGDLTLFRRHRAFLQSKIGHLRP